MLSKNETFPFPWVYLLKFLRARIKPLAIPEPIKTMSGKYDPRKPRPNPEIRDIVRAMESNWKCLKAEKHYSTRRGFALILQALIEDLLEEPEFLYDLVPGPSSGGRHLYKPAEEKPGEPAFLDETPFDQTGLETGRYFFFTSTGVLTPLFVNLEYDPYYPLTLPGTWIYRLEKRYVTPGQTRMRLTSEQALDRCRPRMKKAGREAGEVHHILGDPQGYEAGHSVPSFAITNNLNQALRTADRLASWLEIRVLVGTERSRDCTR